VRKIIIAGNAETREEVVRRELLQAEGAPYDPRRIDASVERLHQTGYFGLVTASTEPVNGDPALVDVTIRVVEKPVIAVSAGVGYSSTERAMAQASIAYPNVGGTGHDLALDFGIGRTFRNVSLSESNRWFTDTGIGRTTRLWYQSSQPLWYLSGSRFRTSGAGLGLRFDIPVDDRNSAYVEPGYEHGWLDTDPLTPLSYQGYVGRWGRTFDAATLRAGWTYDTRDSASRPTRGLIAQGRVEYGLPLGLHYLKVAGALRAYHPLGSSSVLSLTLRGSAGESLESRDYPLQKLDYAGGAETVRGYLANSIGPKDARTGDPLGGTRTLTGSLQATTEVAQLGDRGRVVSFVFLDGGLVAGSPGPRSTHARDSDGARFSYGLGLGWQAPFGTLGASLAQPVKRRDGDRRQPLQVNFETAF
jgi:outer membrane protein insertion porin family